MLSSGKVSNFSSAPMMRGIISKINGIPAEDFAGDHWAIRGDRGLTYSKYLPQNGKIIEGRVESIDILNASKVIDGDVNVSQEILDKTLSFEPFLKMISINGIKGLLIVKSNGLKRITLPQLMVRSLRSPLKKEISILWLLVSI